MKTVIRTPNGQSIEVNIPRRHSSRSAILPIIGTLFLCALILAAVAIDISDRPAGTPNQATRNFQLAHEGQNRSVPRL